MSEGGASFWDGPPRWERDTATGYESLDRARLTPPRAAGPARRLESGHAISWHLAHGDSLREPGEWAMRIWHPGDPAGSHVESRLGQADRELGQRSIAELGHRDVVKEMGEQWQRATAAGDPYGQANETAGWVPLGDGPSHLFRHYE